MKGDHFPAERRVFQDDRTGREIWQITNSGFESSHLYFYNSSFTPKGDKVILMRGNRHGESNIYSVNMDDFEITQLTEGRHVMKSGTKACCISNDGKQVFFTEGPEIWSVDIETFEENRICSALETFSIIDRGVRSLTYCHPSPDGKKIVAVYNAPFNKEWGLIVIRTDGSGGEAILRSRDEIGHCQFCPTDSNILEYCNYGGFNNPDKVGNRMWLINADGTGGRALGSLAPRDWVRHEYWSSSGREIYFSWKALFGKAYNNPKEKEFYPPKGHTVEVRKIQRDGQNEETVVTLNHCHSMINNDGTFIVADNDLGKADDLKLVNLATKGVTILCYSKATWKSGVFHPHPSFSPDDQKVIYTSDATGHCEVYLAIL